MLSLMGDLSMSKLLNRNRGKSDDVDLIPGNLNLMAKQMSSPKPLPWSQIEFASLDEKIISFIEHLHNNPEN